MALAAVLLGCSDPPPTPARPGTAGDAFREVDRVTLDTSVVATIGRLNAWLPLPDRFVVADGMTDRVLAFSRDGAFQAAVGGPGDGPGEFRTPMALLELPDGNVLVADQTPRLTELGPDLALRGVHPLDVPTFAGGLTPSGDDVVLALWLGREAGDNFIHWNRTSGLGASFDPRGAPVPYWSPQPLIVSRAADFVVADNMTYPLRRYGLDGVLIDTLGTPPASWRQASRPGYGEFATPEGQRRAQAWLRSFSVVDGLHTAGDDWLVVSHRHPTNEYREDDTIRADVYAGAPLAKLWEDVVLPGPVLRSDEECVWLVVEGPPEPWTVACWAPRPPRGLPHSRRETNVPSTPHPLYSGEPSRLR